MSFSLFGIARHQGELVALFNPLDQDSKTAPIIQNAAQIQYCIDAATGIDQNTANRLEALLFLMQTMDPKIYHPLSQVIEDYRRDRSSAGLSNTVHAPQSAVTFEYV